MLGQLFIYPLFIVSCVAGLFRPYWGLIGFYAFVFLEPEWNWRWSIPLGSNFQKYIGAATLFGFLLAQLPGNRLKGWLGTSAVCLLGFLALSYLSAFQSISSRFSDFYVNVIMKVIVMAIVTMKLVDTPKKAWILLWVIVVCQGYNAFRINEQYFIDGFSLYARRDWGFKGDNNLYSIFTVPAMAAAFSLAIYAHKYWHRALAGGIFVMQIHQLMLLESRGTMVGALGLAAVGLFLMPKNKYTISATGLAFLLGAALAGPPVVKEFMSAFEPQESRDSSAESRFKLWKAGLQITLDYPLLGVGPYAGQVMVPKYAEDFSAFYNKGLHNLFFEISTGCGLPATILYFSFFLIPWYLITTFYWRSRDQLPDEIGGICLSLAMGIPGYFLASMFSSGALLESSYVLLAGCAGGMWAWWEEPDNEGDSEDLGDDEE